MNGPLHCSCWAKIKGEHWHGEKIFFNIQDVLDKKEALLNNKSIDF